MFVTAKYDTAEGARIKTKQFSHISIPRSIWVFHSEEAHS